MKKFVEMNALRILCFWLLIASISSYASSQTPTTAPACGKAEVHMDGATYLITPAAIFAVELPQGWVMEKSKSNPFYFLKSGEKYSNARTLMYIHIERLETPLQTAVENDARAFRQSCQPSQIREMTAPNILEEGCERETQMFLCNRRDGAYVDLDTKISVGGLLLNVVLSAGDESQISRYQKDYEFLLTHTALVK
ncbi:MAG: hypothetical protein ACRD25_08955 [Terracidiphilus sp.]